ncbi:nuclease harbi1-like protein [Elysia marginata]|uniref:Nuclease harbi1-like protein n=1 Tax=Elysia marginata TaxID=1093978 RepID=A0AAV4GCY5_9GAST|nr:nuclease harbi1-like protein [Elysia marginata]
MANNQTVVSFLHHHCLCSPNNQLNLPEDSAIDGADHLCPLPYVIVADEAFPLQHHMMRPFPGKSSTLEQDAYNYSHSRARRVVENAFGILSERWRVYHTKIAVLPESVKKLVMATTVLHNMLQRQRGVSSESTDAADSHVQQAAALQTLHRIVSRGTNAAIDIRNKFSKYFTEYPLPWQNSYVRGLTN